MDKGGLNNMKKELLEAIKNDMVYDYVANNYWKLRKEELAYIAKELAFAVHTGLGKLTAELVWKEMQENVENDIKEEDK
jgi:hypothetical protein